MTPSSYPSADMQSPRYGLIGTEVGERRQATQSAPARPVLAAPSGVTLWQLIICQLDPLQHGYTTSELAPLLNVDKRHLANLCQRLFPRESRQVYWLTFAQVVRLVRKACQEGRNKPSRDALYCRLLADGVISHSFPDDCPAVQLAERILAAEREVLFRRLR